MTKKYSELEELQELLEKGTITQDEFDRKKSQLLGLDKTDEKRDGNIFWWYGQVIKKYTQSEGRARRKEVWSFILVNFLINVLLNIIEMGINPNYDPDFFWLSSVYSLLVFIPALTLYVRRLHDTGKKGWYIIACIFIPIVGQILWLIWMLQDSHEGENEYGENPKAYLNNPNL